MSTPARTQADPSKINTPTQLLAVFLLVVEGILTFWMFQAESSAERIVAGALMVGLLVVFLLLVRPLWNRTTEAGPVQAPGIPGTMDVGTKEATKREITNPTQQVIPGPDDSYLIARPPPDWKVTKRTLAEWVNDALKISDEKLRQEVLGETEGDVKDILVMRSPRELTVKPVAGRSSVNGRVFPLALELTSPIRLSIVPLQRAQPPLFVEFPFEHNFWKWVGEMIVQAPMLVLRETSDDTTSTGRKRHTVAFSQRLEEVLVDGRDGAAIDVNLTLIGIEGELRDHILVMNYPSMVGEPDPVLEQDLESLKKLVESFSSINVVDADERKQEYAAQAEEDFEAFLQANGATMFQNEFFQFLMRISGWDLDDPEQLLSVVRQLRSFEKFAEAVGYEDEDIASLWPALHEAQEGDLIPLKQVLMELLESGEEEEEQDSTGDEGHEDPSDDETVTTRSPEAETVAGQ